MDRVRQDGAEAGTEAGRSTRLKRQVTLLGLVILIGSGYFLVDHLVIVFDRTRTAATVVKVKPIRLRAGEKTRSYIPTVEFRTGAGKTVRVSTGQGSSQFDFDVGDEVTVYYDEENPRRFYLAVFPMMWGLPIFGVACGLLILRSACRL